MRRRQYPQSKAGPTLTLDFLKGTMPPGGTFSRASAATRVNAAGLLETVAANVPRLDYDPVTLACRGYLTEETSANMLTDTAGANRAVGIGATNNGVTSSVVGTGTEDGIDYVDVRFVGTPTTNAVSADGVLWMNGTSRMAVSEGVNYTISAYCRRVSGTAVIPQIYLCWEAAGNTFLSLASLNLSMTASTLARDRQWITGAAPATAITARVALAIGGLSIGVALDVTLRIGGAQVEAKGFPTSYIPTYGLFASRSFDQLAYPKWSGYAATSGAWAIEYDLLSPYQGNARIISNDGSTHAVIGHVSGGSAESWQGGAAAVTANAAANFLTPNRAAVAYWSGGRRICLNGGAIASDAGAMSVVNQDINIGLARASNSNHFNGHIRKLTYYPYAAPDSMLQALTR
jgi:hypothetical protein